ncbi:MAG TPA: hypothetical protein VFX65_04265 [Candidatus Limnocylindrales bacterium]|nr:hypothetical protein [Candidatus Limnocylindrales bacterium]
MQPHAQPTGPDPDRWTDDPAFAAVEALFADFQEAWGSWMVVHHRGAPIEDGGETEPAIAARLVATRSALGAGLDALDDAALTSDDRAALANLRAALPELDAWAAPLDGMIFAEQAGAVDGLELAHRGDAGGDGDADGSAARFRRATYEAWGAAMAELRVDGERVDRLTVMARLAREEDAAMRRRLFLAMAPGWAVLDGPGGPDDPDGPYRRLLRDAATQWQRSGSPIAANAAALGMDPAAVEPTMRRLLETFRRVAMPADLVEPWDYRYVVGGLARRLDPEIPAARLRPINDAHLASIGADPVSLGIHYDVVPRPGRPLIPTAFTTNLDIARRTPDGWRAATPWVFATYAEGGLGNLEELVHESGHALHVAAVRARPALFASPPDQAAFAEAIADVVGWTVHEPAFLAEHLGATVSERESVVGRYGNVMLDVAWTLFEIEVHRHPDRPPNEAWAEIIEDGLGIAGHPEWSWWAQRGQLIDVPGYLANYALGAVMVAAVRGRIRELRGDWSTGDPGWFPFVAERLLRYGGGRNPASLLVELLGGPLTADALLADLERAAA